MANEPRRQSTASGSKAELQSKQCDFSSQIRAVEGVFRRCELFTTGAKAADCSRIDDPRRQDTSESGLECNAARLAELEAGKVFLALEWKMGHDLEAV